MIIVSNDPSWWMAIDLYRLSSYAIVAASTAVMYDWALTLVDEIELVWRKRLSLMTFLYLSARYLGMLFAAVQILDSVPTIPVTYVGCLIMGIAGMWATLVANAILGVIMITRLNAMYQRSRKVLILLIVILLTVYTTNGVIAIIITRHSSGGELIFSGTYQCTVDYGEDSMLLSFIGSILAAAWEVLALYFAVWIAVKHFCELQRQQSGGTTQNCFAVLMKSHIVYFVSFAAGSCFQLYYLSRMISGAPDPYSLQSQTYYYGFIQIFEVVQMFVLGPRLILSIRAYHTKLVDDSDAATDTTSMVFQERIYVPTSSSV